MGQRLIGIAGLYDPIRGWQDVESTPPIAGEYRALALRAAGISAKQIQMLHNKLLTTTSMVEADTLKELSAEALTGDLLYSTVMSYFAANEVSGQLSAPLAGMTEYPRVSFGSFTAKVQARLVFDVPLTVHFPGLELDIPRFENIIASKVNNHLEQAAYILQSGIRQSTYEHLVPEQLFRDTTQMVEAVSAVKALTVASREGQLIYTITPDTIATVLPQLSLEADVLVEIQEAVATGKIAIASQHNVTVGSWVGTGYIIFDPDTGAGSYQISGGANGAFLLGVVAAILVALVAVIIVLAFTEPAVAIVAARAVSGYLGFHGLSLALLFPAVSDKTPCFWQGFGTTLGVVGLLISLVTQVEVVIWLGRILSAFGWGERFINATPIQRCLLSAD